jgi:phenylpropionate dioxygenase-like ring-hydroxylating dioxygenase large terminal subunit
MTTLTVPEAHLDLARRLVENCEANRGDYCDGSVKMPASMYSDPRRWDDEMERIYRRCPLVVAMSADVPAQGSYQTVEIAGRSIVTVRGDDGVVRSFLNMCRHRGAPVADGCGQARRFTCPYHAWTYDNRGSLVGVPGREAFDDLDVTGLIELPTHERVGLVLSTLTPDAEFDPDQWLGGMADALALMRLDELHRYEPVYAIEGPNWKIAADGYVDGYHIGYLHKNTIGVNSITNRNTFDFFGPHQRVGFATKSTPELRALPQHEWPVYDAISIVHYLFPNVSLAGTPSGSLMVSRLLPGPTHDRSTTLQFHYFRAPIETDEARARAEERREIYRNVVANEDYAMGIRITRNLDALRDEYFRFGRNELGNQHLHTTINELTGVPVRVNG